MTVNNTAEPTKLETWGYGFLFVTIINVGAVLGVCVVPMMNKHLYKKVLMFLICLAVGTLSANAVLSLIPEAHGMLVDTEGQMFVWKNMTVLGGIYLFFLVERILKIIAIKKKEKRQMAGPEKVYTVYETKSPSNHFTPQTLDDHSNAPCNGTNIQFHVMLNGDAERDQMNGDIINHCNHDHSDMDFSTTKKAIASVAYMIVFGDGLHNFIDGLAIGASFTHSIASGISISIAVICEEFPHELGDFAILLKSGLSIRQAVMANLASAVTCYLGLVLGIVLGEVTSAGEWIFALAGGMFLYISLVDMLPEINSSSDPSLSPTNLQIFLLQNAGLLLGFGIILLLTLYGGAIDLTT
ncbi:zinc transporter ZIP14-like [Anneissia japonica]|uniref:zinc transporter ZIP14-like n=1 Tax=Anneissia japonica TaxID=1529436 RepID=UPI0014257030|nr:zinc transporter ZIP14-like [Anneissia japonica]XP_033118380.1 zinc transporter ZIP14-like [Anneissia japonica]